MYQVQINDKSSVALIRGIIFKGRSCRKAWLIREGQDWAVLTPTCIDGVGGDYMKKAQALATLKAILFGRYRGRVTSMRSKWRLRGQSAVEAWTKRRNFILFEQVEIPGFGTLTADVIASLWADETALLLLRNNYAQLFHGTEREADKSGWNHRLEINGDRYAELMAEM